MSKVWLPYVLTLGIFVVAADTFAQQPAVQDTTSHSIQFIPVEKDVSLEVLDWGGSGHPLVLLAGLGMSAHELDQFATQLTKNFHVYGITRRGFGASSKPKSGYDFPRLTQDIVTVLDALHLQAPLLAGHSIAGQELSLLGVTHPQRIAGMVYLDAAFDYTTTVPEEYKTLLGAVTPDSSWLKSLGEKRPESVAGLSANRQIIYSTLKPDYASIKTPALTIFATPSGPKSQFPDYESRHADDRAKMERLQELNVENVHYQSKLFTDGAKRAGMQQSKSIEIVGARHDIYRSNESEVLLAIVEFARQLRLLK